MSQIYKGLPWVSLYSSLPGVFFPPKREREIGPSSAASPWSSKSRPFACLMDCSDLFLTPAFLSNHGKGHLLSFLYLQGLTDAWILLKSWRNKRIGSLSMSIAGGRYKC